MKLHALALNRNMKYSHVPIMSVPATELELNSLHFNTHKVNNDKMNRVISCTITQFMSTNMYTFINEAFPSI